MTERLCHEVYCTAFSYYYYKPPKLSFRGRITHIAAFQIKKADFIILF
ncbi:hypothetical protein BRYFOR_06897 [Marvinbryantia formatexigens DSM 14469]|uniref:Uncharacterized protein n=1 Tax=Marvinbryantia formatexigens DSM 14469 TaxID=478749 RepID=C6LE48_9FIRM|nr:hypothetical protein BRYFOR_06897 [Marvinbryantia formatexigens DSM 14469]